MENKAKADKFISLNILGDQISSFPKRLSFIIGDNSIRSFANKINMSEATIRKYLKGESEPTLTNLLSMSKAGNVSVSWLATGQPTDSDDNNINMDDEKNYVIVPDLNIKVSAGAGTIPVEDKMAEFIFHKNWLQKEGLSNANLAVFHVEGDSMESTIHDGDIALVNVRESGWTGAINGIFILLVDDMLVIKRIEFDLIQKGIHVISDNPAYRPYFLKLDEENTTIKVLAKVERILTTI